MRIVSICVIVLMAVFIMIQDSAAVPKKGTLRVSGDNSWEAYVHDLEG